MSYFSILNEDGVALLRSAAETVGEHAGELDGVEVFHPSLIPILVLIIRRVLALDLEHFPSHTGVFSDRYRGLIRLGPPMLQGERK